MPLLRLSKWSIVVVLLASAGLNAQDESLQKLFESGRYEAVIERAAEGRAASPDDTYVTALAFLKLERAEGAAAEFRRLRDQDEEAWRLIGVSALARAEHNDAEAVNAARRATELAGDNMFAHYQLGLAASSQTDWATSARAFDRATEVRPDFAYAHYNAGLAYQKHGNLGKASDHLNTFLRLAPDAPERPGVLAILRAMRK